MSLEDGPAADDRRASAEHARADDGPRALITGIAGQDGSYLAELLLEKGYEVFGRRARLARRALPEPRRASATTSQLLQGDLLDQMTLLDAITRAEPDELYNLAATSFVPGVVAPAGDDRAVHRGRRDLDARGGPHHQARAPHLPGLDARRSSAPPRESPQTEHDAVPARTTRTRVAKLYGHLMVSDLPRALRHARQLGDPLQPRVAAPPAGVRHPQDHPRRGGDQARARRTSCAWATWTPRATGASPATSPRRCG